MEAVADDNPQAEVQDRDEFREAAGANVDMLLNLIYALLALAVFIALLGIANTLALSIFERTRELGLLRAVGMTRSQLRATVRYESVIIALLGTALGLTIGIVFGWAFVQALSDVGVEQLRHPGQSARRGHGHRRRRRRRRRRSCRPAGPLASTSWGPS